MAYTSFQPKDHFQTKNYTGNGTAFGSGGNALTGVGFQPDLTWIKSRSAGEDPVVTDSVRGTTKIIRPSGTAAESTASEGLNTFGSDGFTVGNSDQFNTNSGTYVSWNWKAGTTSGIAGSPSITPTSYSFNATAGFSIIKYTGTGSAATLPHGLGTAPQMIIQKNLADTENWQVYHRYILAWGSEGKERYLTLNTTNGLNTQTSRWNDTAPTSTLFTIGSDSSVNGSGEDCIAYCFAGVKGYSQFGVFRGIGDTDGNFIACGFRPGWILIKQTNTDGQDWFCFDSVRGTRNVNEWEIKTNSSAAETDANHELDIFATGFKIKTNGAGLNAGDGTFVYAAFAKHPIVGTNNTPAVAV